MGWSFGFHKSKESIVAHLRSSLCWGADYKIRKSSVVGNCLWFQVEQISTGDVFILLELLQGPDKKGGEWGNKSMSENSGPCYYDCPVSYLNGLSEATGYAIEWRASVRTFHANKQKSKMLVAGLEVGQQILHANELYILVRDFGLRGWAVNSPDGSLKRMPLKMVKAAVVANAVR